MSVECLPAKIPDRITMDISTLVEPDQVLRVADIELEEGITVLNNPELLVARISIRPVEVVGEAMADFEAEAEVVEGSVEEATEE